MPDDETQRANDPTEETGAKNDDNPRPPDDAGQKGAGTQSGAIGGLEHGTEPEGEETRQHERP